MVAPRPDHYQLSISESCYTVVPVYLEANVVAPILQINRPDGAIILNSTKIKRPILSSSFV